MAIAGITAGHLVPWLVCILRIAKTAISVTVSAADVYHWTHGIIVEPKVAAESCRPQAISISGADSGTSTANKAEA